MRKNDKIAAAEYCVYLFYALYVVILFIERAVSLVKGFTDSDYIFYNSYDFVQWYAHIVTAAGLLVCFVTAVTVNRYVFVLLFTRAAAHKARTDYSSMAVTAGAVLAGGMAHTEFTLLWLQFVSYGALLISMLLRTIIAAGLFRPDVSKGRLAVSYAYMLCLSMAIPVVYGTSVPTRKFFISLEIVTAQLLVFAFCFKLAYFYASGGLTNFGLPSTVCAAAADITLFVLRFGEMPNYFLLAFIVLTVLFFVIGRALYGNRTLLYFGGHRRKRGYFEGWYLKLFNEKETLAFIPSYHADVNGKRYAMLQIIGTDKPLKFVFDADELEAKEDEFRVRLPGCDFSCKGMRFSLECCGHSLNGGIVFDGVAPPKKDIMGFFAGFPFMQCKHGVLSMLHNVNGKIIVDGKVYDFDGAYGYMEKDFGSSFPSSYVWTQSSDGKNSVMLSVARIPYLGATFTGCVAFVYVGGREYRLATYNGAKVMRNDAECVAIGRFAEKLEIYPIRENAHALAAPESGSMSRTVYETAAAVVRCVFTIKGDTVLDMTVSAAGYERCD